LSKQVSLRLVDSTSLRTGNVPGRWRPTGRVDV